MRVRTNWMIAATVVVALAGQASAQFTPGRLVVTQLGDPAVPPASGVAAAVTLVEFNLSGTPSGYTVPLPTAPGSTRLTMSISATSEGALTRSIDGTRLSVVGYDAAPGTGSVASAAGIRRVTAGVDFNGVSTLTLMPTTSYVTNNIRSAVSTDGSKIWTSGAGSSNSGGVWFTNSDGTGANQIAPTPAVTNTRVINAYDGNLYVSSQSGANVGINLVSGGLAENGPQTISLLPGFSSVSGLSPYDFWFANDDTLYVADDGSLTGQGGLQKWIRNAGTWSLSYILRNGLNVGLRGLTGTFDATGAPVLYAITGQASTSPTALVTVTDLGVASPFTTLAVSPTNTIFRGVEFSPIPEPATLVMLTIGGVALLRRRR